MRTLIVSSLAALLLATFLLGQRLDQVKQRVTDQRLLINALTLSNQQLEDRILVLNWRVRTLSGSLIVVPQEGKQ